MRTLKYALMVVAALMTYSLTAVVAEAKTVINLCTGAEGQPYSVAGEMIADQLGNDPNLEIRVIVDTGGTWGNIQRTTGGSPTQDDYDSGRACHAFIGQPDGPALLKRTNPAEAMRIRQVGVAHREYLHVLCSKESGIGDLYDMGGSDAYRVALGNQGSGAWLIWENFKFEDESYAKIATVTDEGISAVSSVAANEITCVLVPAALGNKTVREADELYGQDLTLAGANDKDFNDAVDLNGKPLYQFMKIPSGTYARNLQGWFSGTTTVSWRAGVYLNKSRVTDEKALNAFIRAVGRAKPLIEQQFGG